jgi:ATP-dependent exoDNAse (exonuclease V) beta subunit
MGMQAPGQDTLCGGSTQELTSKYVLAKTELLVYSLELRMAGQVDLLMRNEDSTEYHILDYKFIKEPLEKELLQQIYSGIK